MGSHPTQDGCHGAHRRPFRVVHRRILPDGCKKPVVLQLIGVCAAFTAPSAASLQITYGLRCRIRLPRCADEGSTATVPGTGDASNLAIQPRAIGIFIFNEKRIKDIPVSWRIATVSPSHSLGPYRVASFHPIDDVGIMYLERSWRACPEPIEIPPVSHLVFHFGLVGGTVHMAYRTDQIVIRC